MNCPNCGNVMEKGFMHTQKYPFWTQQELRFFKGPTDQVDLGPIGDDTIYKRPLSGVSGHYDLPGLPTGCVPLQYDR